MGRPEYDSIIVLSNRMNEDGSLHEESALRVREGVRLLKDRVADHIVMNGGAGKRADGSIPEYGEAGVPVQAHSMRDYATGELGVDPDRIRIQDFSKDTVGEAHFVNGMVLGPEGWNKNVLLTSDYHIARAGRIYAVALGPGFETKMHAVDTRELGEDHNGEGLATWLDGESRGIRNFEGDFGDITPGDHKGFEKRLYEKHGLYNSGRLPVEQRKLFFTKPEDYE